MTDDNRKVALIGTGMVGMSFAFALTNNNLCNELVLIDIDQDKAEGEAMDLNHGMAFAHTKMKIYAGVYGDCADADIVVITAGANQRPEETRLDLLHRNADIITSIVEQVVDSGFEGIFLVASNPVDIMTRLVQRVSGFDHKRVIGSGTTLDTARLRYLIGDYFNIDSRNVHAYVMGEHGDSEFVPWSQALISTVPIKDMCERSSCSCTSSDLIQIEDDVRNAAYVVIKAKNATYYGIGMSLVRIVRAIFNDERSVLTVSTHIDGQYDEKDIYIGIPSVVGRTGVVDTMPIDLTEEELKKFHNSCDVLRKHYNEIDTAKTAK